MRSILQGMVVLGALISASAAFADDALEKPYVFVLPKTRDAHEHLKRGVRLYNNQSFEAAIEEFKAGALAEPCATFDYNLGQSYRQLGRHKEALWHYQRFLNNGKPTGEVLAAVQQWVAEMQAHLTNAAPTSPTEPAPEETSGSATGALAPMPTAARRDLAVLNETRRDDRASINWVGWTATGVGVAALGVTGFLFLRASSLEERANATPDALQRGELRDEAGTRRLAAAVIVGGGVVLTAVGAYMLAAQSPRGNHTAVSVDVGLGNRGIVAFGRF
jgi:tetratricopeptide (TPR) repeat protein